MANLSNSKTLFFFTSPRTPTKTLNEIKLLTDNFSGKKWDTDNQKKFATLLSKAGFFEGGDFIKENSDFGARDRINRAPKALGFVNLDPIALTPIGKRLLSEKRVGETFTRQFMKFQLPSPYHTDKEGRYKVKPYLEILRLVYDMGGLTKDEIALFGMRLINIDLYSKITKEIEEFRKQKSEKKYTRKREFVHKYYVKIIGEIFKEEITKGNLKLRESDNADINKFIATKKSSLRDYADAAVRYLKVTGLVSFKMNSLRLEIIEDRKKDVEYLLNTIEREPISFKDKEKFQEYLFDDSNVQLYTDNKKELIEKVRILAEQLVKLSAIKSVPKLETLNIETLKDLLGDYETKKISLVITKQKEDLQTYEDYSDVVDIYKKIEEREVVDPSLVLEWNTWRAMAMMDDGEIKGNFKIDTDGSPLFTAPAKVPDIECHYKDFSIIVEVTTATGQKQYDMEGEPVARHLGQFKKEMKKDSFCLFLAKKISEGTLSHFYALHKMDISYYGGKSQIIPMNLEAFQKMVNHAKEKGGINSNQLYKYFKFLTDKVPEAKNELEWFDEIESSAPKWTEVIA